MFKHIFRVGGLTKANLIIKIDGVDICKFGKQWVVSTEAMKREYGIVAR